MIHACPDLKKQFFENADAARESLVEQARLIHDVEGLMVSVVFDGGGSEILFENPGNQPTFTVIYANRELTADGVIEQLVLKFDNPKKCTIISRDNMIRSSVRAAGAVAFDAAYLMDWVERCARQQIQTLNQHRKKEQKKWKQSSPWDQLG